MIVINQINTSRLLVFYTLMLQYPVMEKERQYKNKTEWGRKLLRPGFKEFDLVKTDRNMADLFRGLATVSKGLSEAVLHPERFLNPLAKSKKRW